MLLKRGIKLQSMKLEIPKIKIERFDKSQLIIYQGLDNSLYGSELANKICHKLKQNPGEYDGLHFSHRDYCGLGIFYINQVYLLGVVNDGYGPNPIVASFDTDTEFENWLAKESDQSMSLYGTHFNNQTINRKRLDWYLEDNYSSSWNSYCLYLNSREDKG